MPQSSQIDQSIETQSGFPPPDQMDDEINLVDLIYPVYNRRKFLIIFCIVVTLTVAIITLRMPKTYEATVVILPTPNKKESGVIVNLKDAIFDQFGLQGVGNISGTMDMSVLLRSKEIEHSVKTRYNFSLTGANGHFSVMVQKGKKEGDSITVQANDPIMAADIANTYLMELDVFNRKRTVTSAQRLRKYIESRLADVNIELEKAQKKLREFQEENKAVSIEKQTEATLEVLAGLEAQRVVLEVQKAAREKFYKGPHREIDQLNAQMEALQKNIDRLTYSKEPKVPVVHEKGEVEFYIPLQRIPALNFDESRLLLTVKTKTGVVTMLTAQLEQTKLEEAKDMPTINALDWAEPPGRPIKPRLKLNVLLSVVVSLFLGVFIIFFLEFIQRMDQDPDTSPKWREIKKGLTSLIPFSKKSKQ